MKRFLLILIRGGRALLSDSQCVACHLGIISASGSQFGGASLLVPESELREIQAAGMFHSTDKRFSCHCLTIVVIKILVAAFSKQNRAKQVCQHSHHFSTFDVNR